MAEMARETGRNNEIGRRTVRERNGRKSGRARVSFEKHFGGRKDREPPGMTS